MRETAGEICDRSFDQRRYGGQRSHLVRAAVNVVEHGPAGASGA